MLCGCFCYDSSCGWTHLLPTCLALRLGTLPHFRYNSSCGCPSYHLAMPCLWAPNLAQAILKKLNRSQNCSLSDIRFVFFPSAPLRGYFLYDSSCGWGPLLPTRLALRLGTLPPFCYVSSCGCPSCQLALPC
jgi:hypothetical protein